MSVGGTCISSNVPLIESLPPIAAVSNSNCASKAPSKAWSGLPHFSASVPSRSKYSWKLKRASLWFPPLATSFAKDSTTAYPPIKNGFLLAKSVENPQVDIAQVEVLLFNIGMVFTLARAGVLRCFPPRGISTVVRPTCESKFSISPFCEATLSWESSFLNCSIVRGVIAWVSAQLLLTALACIDFSVPAVSKNSRSRSTIISPRQKICILPLSVTSATSTASRFSCAACAINESTSLASTTTAIRSCDSEMASSVPLSPEYLVGSLSRLIFKLSAISPIATDTPPAPKSLHFLMSLVTSGLRKRRCIFRSSTASPFCTSALSVVMADLSCTLLLPDAPPTPSRPVLPPTMTTLSPVAGASLRTQSLGTAPAT